MFVSLSGRQACTCRADCPPPSLSWKCIWRADSFSRPPLRLPTSSGSYLFPDGGFPVTDWCIQDGLKGRYLLMERGHGWVGVMSMPKSHDVSSINQYELRGGNTSTWENIISDCFTWGHTPLDQWLETLFPWPKYLYSYSNNFWIHILKVRKSIPYTQLVFKQVLFSAH